MLKIMKIFDNRPRQQRGVAAVEFAIVAMLLLTLLFGIIEFGRLFYVFNTVQEVTRRAAREAVVRWHNQQDTVKKLALFGASALPANLPAGVEITDNRITIDYLNSINPDVVISPADYPNSPADNISACLASANNCIAFVQVSITGATYAPMVSLFPYFRVPIPASTVTMPAESMGYTIN